MMHILSVEHECESPSLCPTICGLVSTGSTVQCTHTRPEAHFKETLKAYLNICGQRQYWYLLYLWSVCSTYYKVNWYSSLHLKLLYSDDLWRFLYWQHYWNTWHLQLQNIFCLWLVSLTDLCFFMALKISQDHNLGRKKLANVCFDVLIFNIFHMPTPLQWALSCSLVLFFSSTYYNMVQLTRVGLVKHAFLYI